MSDVASPAVCRELYGLSGWVTESTVLSAQYGRYYEYDAGYLLRKLPPRDAAYRSLQLEPYEEPLFLEEPAWNCGYYTTDPALFTGFTTDANTPEDALAKLAIKLFESGVLKRVKP